MSGRHRAWFVLLVATAVLAAGCQGEPPPTVAEPPNPTSAPAGVLPGCVVNQGAQRPTPSTGVDYRIAQPGILLVGSAASLPPFESLNAAGTASGFDVDLIAEVAHRLGLRPEIQNEPEPMLLGDVAAGRTDVAISALAILASSKAVVDFTDPYFTADLALSVAAPHALNFGGIATLAGKVVGVAAGSLGQACAGALAPSDRFSVRPYTDISQAFTDLAVGRIGAVLTDVPTSQRLVQAITGLQMVAVYRTNDDYGIAVSKSNPDLRAAINRVLTDMRQDGTYRIIYEKWFQVPPPGG